MDDYTQNLDKFTRIGTNSSNLLLCLIEDILNLSKMDAGIFTINTSDFYVKELIDEVFDVYYQQ